MRQALIGTGGWAYFNMPSPLRAYAKAFDYVEVNSTFYEMPDVGLVKKWRRSVPESFHFSVRAHRSITHGRPFENTDAAHGGFDRMLEICRILRADVLHLLLPPATLVDASLARNLSSFLDCHDAGPTLLALESRGEPALERCPDLVKLMQDRSIIHSIDPLKGESPAYPADTLYARLFGPGHHNLYQPTDGELKSLDDLATGYGRAFLTFHGVKMYSDAARLKAYNAKGTFPPLTKTTGLESLSEVLREDSHFPTTKAELVRDQGWKLFESGGGKRTKVEEALFSLPDIAYSSLEEVLKAAREGGSVS